MFGLRACTSSKLIEAKLAGRLFVCSSMHLGRYHAPPAEATGPTHPPTLHTSLMCPCSLPCLCTRGLCHWQALSSSGNTDTFSRTHTAKTCGLHSSSSSSRSGIEISGSPATQASTYGPAQSLLGSCAAGAWKRTQVSWCSPNESNCCSSYPQRTQPSPASPVSEICSGNAAVVIVAVGTLAKRWNLGGWTRRRLRLAIAAALLSLAARQGVPSSCTA